jgi:hypothetical protein
MRRRPGILTLLCLATAIGGCGGAGNSPTTGATVSSGPDGTTVDEGAIRETISALATETDPDLCDRSLTQNFLDQSYPPAGAGALEDCRHQQLPAYKLEASGVRFDDVSVDGDAATASFELLGPDVGGSRSTVGLIRDSAGIWRVDDVIAAKVVDERRFLTSLRASAMNGPGGLSAAHADCVVAGVAKIPVPEIERRAVSDNRNLPVPIVADCLGEGSVTAAVAELVRGTLAADPDYGAFAGCAGRHLAGAITLEQAGEFLRAEDRDTVRLLTAKALADCGAGSGAGPAEHSLT